jgi:hypothetical protein
MEVSPGFAFKGYTPAVSLKNGQVLRNNGEAEGKKTRVWNLLKGRRIGERAIRIGERIHLVQVAIPVGGEEAARSFYIGILGFTEQQNSGRDGRTQQHLVRSRPGESSRRC